MAIETVNALTQRLIPAHVKETQITKNHPPDVLRCESYSEKTRIQNIAVSGEQARCLAPISVS